MASIDQLLACRASALAWLEQLEAQLAITRAYVNAAQVYKPPEKRDSAHLSASLLALLRWRQLAKESCLDDPLQTKLPL